MEFALSSEQTDLEGKFGDVYSNPSVSGVWCVHVVVVHVVVWCVHDVLFLNLANTGCGLYLNFPSQDTVRVLGHHRPEPPSTERDQSLWDAYRLKPGR